MEKKVAQGFSYMIRIWQMWSWRRKTVFWFQKLAALHQQKNGAELFVTFSPERRKSCTWYTTEEGAARFGKSCSFFGRNFMLNNGVECQSPGPVPPSSMGRYVLGFLKTGIWTIAIKFGHEHWATRILKLKKSDFPGRFGILGLLCRRHVSRRFHHLLVSKAENVRELRESMRKLARNDSRKSLATISSRKLAKESSRKVPLFAMHACKAENSGLRKVMAKAYYLWLG